MEKLISGQWVDGRAYINTSDLYTELIKEAAACDNWSSDIIIDIQHMENLIYKIPAPFEEQIILGFRDHGVDGCEFVKLRYKHKNLDKYRKLYVITLKKSSNNILVSYDSYHTQKDIQSILTDIYMKGE